MIKVEDNPILLAEWIAAQLEQGQEVPAYQFKRLRDLQGTKPYVEPDDAPSR